jgi:hypothetical protein
MRSTNSRARRTVDGILQYERSTDSVFGDTHTVLKNLPRSVSIALPKKKIGDVESPTLDMLEFFQQNL